jgi:hypothetical protein
MGKVESKNLESLPGGSTIGDQTNLDSLIALLRQELDQIDQAILELKRIAMAREAGARCRVRRNLRVHVHKARSKDRVLKG